MEKSWEKHFGGCLDIPEAILYDDLTFMSVIPGSLKVAQQDTQRKTDDRGHTAAHPDLNRYLNSKPFSGVLL